MPAVIATGTLTFRELTGSENIQVHFRARVPPVELTSVALKKGTPLFVEGIRKRTAFKYRRRLEEFIGKSIRIAAASVDGDDGYVFTLDAPKAPTGHSRSR